MNFFEYIIFVITGPLNQTLRYGNFLWIANPLILACLQSQYSSVVVALTLGLLYFIFNFYQIYTESVVKNGVFGELDQATSNEIDALANREKIFFAKKVLVTNFTYKTVTFGRFTHNAELYISHHWFENDEARQNLSTNLEIVIAGIKDNQLRNTAILASLGYTTSTLILFALKPILVANIPHGIYYLIAGNILAQIAANYGIAAFTRHNIYKSYEMAAHHIKPEKLIEYINFIDPTGAYDKSVASFPNWKLSIPRFANVIAHLNALENKNQI